MTSECPHDQHSSSKYFDTYISRVLLNFYFFFVLSQDLQRVGCSAAPPLDGTSVLPAGGYLSIALRVKNSIIEASK